VGGVGANTHCRKENPSGEGGGRPTITIKKRKLEDTGKFRGRVKIGEPTKGKDTFLHWTGVDGKK